ncbi:MAG: hypothetical protein A6D91_10095 [Bacillaceae bacterium G1]|nr:hypothetical protein [Bacillota bacterium]OJF17619.1 MAG: hypothetical protein A6D91_10095 [Bacillaceae bacterium G1]
MQMKDMLFAAMMAAITAVMGLFPGIPLPGGVPIVLQNMGIMLAGSLLGKRNGALAILLFVLLVAAGLPLLSGGRGGLSVLAGPSGGYIASWPIMAFLIGWLAEKGPRTFRRLFLANLAGGLFNYACGTAWLAMVAHLSLPQALLAGVLPFLPGDLIKMAAAAFLAVGIHRAAPHLFSPANGKAQPPQPTEPTQ